MGPAPGDKIWDWCTILQYFAEYLKRVLTLGPRYYRSSNFVLDFNMWETFESNLPVCQPYCVWIFFCEAGSFLVKCQTVQHCKVSLQRMSDQIFAPVKTEKKLYYSIIRIGNE